jgi:hypothetical protein
MKQGINIFLGLKARMVELRNSLMPVTSMATVITFMKHVNTIVFVHN